MKRLCVVVGLAIGAALLAGPAMAFDWYTSGSPLQVSEAGTVRGSAYGTFINVNGSYARSGSYQRDNRNNGNSVFVNTDFQFKPWPVPAYYTTLADQQTPRTSSSTYTYYYKQTRLNPSSEGARGKIKFCEDQSFSGDPCSSQVIATFNY